MGAGGGRKEGGEKEEGGGRAAFKMVVIFLMSELSSQRTPYEPVPPVFYIICRVSRASASSS